jgi:hypothetical protein
LIDFEMMMVVDDNGLMKFELRVPHCLTILQNIGFYSTIADSRPPNQYSLEGNLFRVALACFVLRHPIQVLTIQPVHHNPNYVPRGRNLHTRCSGSIIGMLLIDVRVSCVLWSWGGVTSPSVLSRVLLDVTPTLGFHNPPITPVQSGGSSHDTFARNGRSCPRLCSRDWSVDPRACSAR